MSDKEIEKFGERFGSVKEVHSEDYIILLNMESGYQLYKVPIEYATTPLKIGDEIKCVIVEREKKLKPRLEKVPDQGIRPETLKKYDELVEQRLEEFKKELS